MFHTVTTSHNNTTMTFLDDQDEMTTPTLESILDAPESDTFKEFAAYLHQSYCIENLAFWIATQEYHKQYESSKKRKELCGNMIHRYIRPNSSLEINIPCDMRQSILDHYYQDNCHLHIFDEAAEAVLELMRVNSYLPWITSSNNSSHLPSPTTTTHSLSTCSSPPRSPPSSFKPTPPPPPPSSSSQQQQQQQHGSKRTKGCLNHSNSSSTLSTHATTDTLLSASSTTSHQQSKWMQLIKHQRNCVSLDLGQLSPSNDSFTQHISSSSSSPLTPTSTTSSSFATVGSKQYCKSMLRKMKRSFLGQPPSQSNSK
ncbi:RGS domain-containing protein [Mycotypha africana]|uniref:RGS domain-containing protein n=1 Tax=Mycotypha africana TaxID=64632 RepID=UPI0023018FF5|nr:RGS domain-containing protein [Mycotypha africana]KAI8991233.1 RGS domain-containing protein [Mycotypha africana]